MIGLGWSAVLTAISILLFLGFAPGAAVRFFSLAYPKGDPRRAEMRAELSAVPRLERWLWVGEQAEIALFVGIPGRLRALDLTRRTIALATLLVAVSTALAFQSSTAAAAVLVAALFPMIICIALLVRDIRRTLERMQRRLHPRDRRNDYSGAYNERLRRTALDARLASIFREMDRVARPVVCGAYGCMAVVGLRRWFAGSLVGAGFSFR